MSLHGSSFDFKRKLGGLLQPGVGQQIPGLSQRGIAPAPGPVGLNSVPGGLPIQPGGAASLPGLGVPGRGGAVGPVPQDLTGLGGAGPVLAARGAGGGVQQKVGGLFAPKPGPAPGGLLGRFNPNATDFNAAARGLAGPPVDIPPILRPQGGNGPLTPPPGTVLTAGPENLNGVGDGFGGGGNVGSANPRGLRPDNTSPSGLVNGGIDRFLGPGSPFGSFPGGFPSYNGDFLGGIFPGGSGSGSDDRDYFRSIY